MQNAVKYNKRGGTISITTELREDEESQSLNQMVFETTITDDGKGIKKERLPYLFKIFGELKHNLEIQND